MAPLLEFRAGRSFRQGETNEVVSNPDRGLIYLEEEDGLLHFFYKDLATSSVLEDLIIFPGDASFQIANKEHRVSVLKFNSSSARHFFWHQDRDLTDQDFAQRNQRVNELIGSEESEGQDAGMQVEAAASASSSSADPAPSASTTSTSARGGPPAVSGQQALQLENILSAFRAASGGSKSGPSGAGTDLRALQTAMRGSSGAPKFTLQDVLPASALTSLIESLPDSSLAHLSSFLPPSLPASTPATQRASLVRALTSPEFRKSAASLDRALRTGATGPVLRSLGMERGAEGVSEFLDEIARGVEREKDSAASGERTEETTREQGTEQRGSDDMQE